MIHCVMSDLLSRLDPLILQVQHLKAVQKNFFCGLGESGGERRAQRARRQTADVLDGQLKKHSQHY